MKKLENIKRSIIIILSSSILTVFFNIACTNNKQEIVKAPKGMMALDLSKYGKPFSIFVPDTTIMKLSVAEQSWGALEVKVGHNFQISITEDPGDIAFKKSDIKSNDVNIFKSFLIDEPLTIMWESEITKPEYHFYSIQKIGTATYVFEDITPADGQVISKDATQKMLDSVKSLVENQKLES